MSTRRQRRIENKRRHRALRNMTVVTYDDLIRMHDRNPKRRRRNPSDYSLGDDHIHTSGPHGKRYAGKSHGGYGSAYAQGTAAGNMKRDRSPHWSLSASEKVEWLKGYDESHAQRKNPRISFRARGKRVSFRARARRRGAVPKQLRPYVYRKR